MITFRFFCSNYITNYISYHSHYYIFALTVGYSLEYKTFMDIIFHTRKGQAHAAFKNLNKPSMDPQTTIPLSKFEAGELLIFSTDCVHASGSTGL